MSRLRSSGTRPAVENPSSIDHLRRPGGGDLLAGALAEGLEAYGEGVPERPVGETLDGPPAAHEAPLPQRRRLDRAAGGERGQVAQVDDRVLDARQRLEAALRKTALER